MSFATPEWDFTLFKLINMSWRNDILDVAMPAISNSILLWGIALSIIALIIVRTKRWREILTGLVLVALTAGATDFSTNMIKKSAGRVRPYNSVPGTNYYSKGAKEWKQLPADFVQKKKRGSSFVSAHAANSMAVAVMAALIWTKVRAFIWLLPLLVGYSRVYIGKHYPMDVLCGWLVGIVIALIIWRYIFKKFIPKQWQPNWTPSSSAISTGS